MHEKTCTELRKIDAGPGKRNAYLAVPVLASQHERSITFLVGFVDLCPFLEQVEGNLLVTRWV